MGSGWPDNERVQEPTIGGDAFNRRDQRPLYRGPSMLSQIVFVDEYSNIRNWLPCFAQTTYLKPHRQDDGETS
jgi:hypothetical protein